MNEDFCDHLEYRMSQELKKSNDLELKGFWCDGVSPSSDHSQLAREKVRDNRKMKTIAWIGKTGQTQYEATIYFGEKALGSFEKETDLICCIPKTDSKHEWIKIDTFKKSIEIKLL